MTFEHRRFAKHICRVDGDIIAWWWDDDDYVTIANGSVEMAIKKADLPNYLVAMGRANDDYVNKLNAKATVESENWA